MLRLPLILAWIGLAACGGGDGVGSSLADGAPIADASAADAAACALTPCGGECVDTASDPAHCGGCDLACDSPGQICSGALPCACPPDFIPADLVQPPASGINPRLIPGLLVAVGPVLDGDRFSALLVGFDEETPTGADIDLAEVTPPGPPLIAAAYDFDIQTTDVRTPYVATSGTVVFSEVCAAGVRGTLADAVFAEVVAVTDPTPVDGGCQISVAELAFDLGEPCAAPDAGL